MLTSEYLEGFRVIRRRIGFWAALRMGVPAFFRALTVRHKAGGASDPAEATKAGLKNRFQLLAELYRKLQGRYGKARTDEIMRDVLREGGYVYFRGFRRLGPSEGLRDFAGIYRAFERNNIVFDVIEETDERFEIQVRRCLVFEAFNELGAPALTQWMCEIAFHYFSRYHPRMTYEKDRMIARGDAGCHEVFSWG
ncbi:MAG: L-2-amino-thiazoline-4-carboxylic acid hydrolase [Spirochaetes bacterium]|nr:L-2-amino-thiazoline-4-carboxylic acid hydrolase [Spirochaetota bacterium]